MKMSKSEIFLFITSNLLYVLILFTVVGVFLSPKEVTKLSPIIFTLLAPLAIYRGIVIYILNSRYLNVQKSLAVSGLGKIAWSFPVKRFTHELIRLIVGGSICLVWLIWYVLSKG